MKTFKVGCNNIEHFNILIKANSKEEALRKAVNIIEEKGTPKNADIFEREYDAVCAEETT
jgi:mannitol/fructose-specific phosphotransferase system IIA component (Ntr-type)